MIIDGLHQVKLYNPPSNVLSDSIDFVLTNKFSMKSGNTYSIGKQGIYVIPQEYVVTKMEEKAIESHRKFIDIQVMMEGMEYLGYAEKKSLQSLGYDEEHDFERMAGTLTFLPLRQEFFAVLFPQDAHMPGVLGPGSTPAVKKMVIKVPVSLW
jgi:YhcH/YjgK/YiaL family protein